MEDFLQKRHDLINIYGGYLSNPDNFNECPNMKGDEYYEILPPTGYAAHSGDLDFLKTLLSYGGKLEWYVYYAACYKNRHNIIDYFIETNSKIPNQCLHIACGRNHYDLVVKLLQYGLNPNEIYKSKHMDWIGYRFGLEYKTPLMISTSSTDILNALYSHGAVK